MRFLALCLFLAFGTTICLANERDREIIQLVGFEGVWSANCENSQSTRVTMSMSPFEYRLKAPSVGFAARYEIEAAELLDEDKLRILMKTINIEAKQFDNRLIGQETDLVLRKEATGFRT